MPTKPSLYPDTNVLSFLHYNGSHLIAVAQHRKTKDWWDYERHHFKLVTSRQTEDELADGFYPGQAHALAAVRRLSYLRKNAAIQRCATAYMEAGIVPDAELGDAIQLAFATVYRIDYLLTWNYSHIANPEVQRKFDSLNARQNWRSPFLVSPETIPWASLGQEIRRNDEA